MRHWGINWGPLVSGQRDASTVLRPYRLYIGHMGLAVGVERVPFFGMQEGL